MTIGGEVCSTIICSMVRFNSLLASGDLSYADDICKQFGLRSGPT